MKAVSEVVGAAIAISIVVATMVPLAIVVMDSQRIAARALEEKVRALEERLSEDLDLSAWRNSATGTIWILVRNGGGGDVEIAHVMAVPAARPEDLATSSFSPGEIIVRPGESISIDTGIRAGPGDDVLVKIVTGRGRIYSAWAGSPPGAPGLAVVLKNLEKGATYNVTVEAPAGFRRSLLISSEASGSSAEVSISAPPGRIHLKVYVLTGRGWELIYEVQAEIPGVDKISVGLPTR